VEEQNCPARQRMLRKQKRQRGQALVEFAVVMSFVLFPIFAGAVDLSNLLDSHLGIVYATRQAARVGAEEDQNAVADCAILGSIFAATQNLNLVTVTRIVIFQIDSTGTVTGKKDVYAGNPGCPNPASPPVASPNTWNPAVTPSLRNDTPPNEDSIGIEIDYTYSWQTGFIATGSFTGTDQTIMKLNPVV
jgi:Flp pilus assembly protein TadG